MLPGSPWSSSIEMRSFASMSICAKSSRPFVHLVHVHESVGSGMFPSSLRKSAQVLRIHFNSRPIPLQISVVAFEHPSCHSESCRCLLRRRPISRHHFMLTRLRSSPVSTSAWSRAHWKKGSSTSSKPGFIYVHSNTDGCTGVDAPDAQNGGIN